MKRNLLRPLKCPVSSLLHSPVCSQRPSSSAALGHAERHPTGVAPHCVARGAHRCDGWLMPS
jgi:hypothetical protein